MRKLWNAIETVALIVCLILFGDRHLDPHESDTWDN